MVPAELEPRGDESALQSVGRGAARAGAAIGGLAKASARGIRQVGEATGRAARGARGALTRKPADDPAPADPAPADQTPTHE